MILERLNGTILYQRNTFYKTADSVFFGSARVTGTLFVERDVTI